MSGMASFQLLRSQLNGATLLPPRRKRGRNMLGVLFPLFHPRKRIVNAVTVLHDLQRDRRLRRARELRGVPSRHFGSRIPTWMYRIHAQRGFEEMALRWEKLDKKEGIGESILEMDFDSPGSVGTR